jgi:hypothetical protein
MAVTGFDYGNLLSAQATRGAYGPGQGWAPGSAFNAANSGRFSSTLGGETARGAASTRNQALQEIYGMYRQNLSNMAQLSGQAFGQTMDVSRTGLGEIGGTNRSMFQNTAVMADNALNAKSNAQVNQANLDQNAYIARQQQKEAAAARSGNQIAGGLGFVADLAKTFIPNPATKIAADLAGKTLNKAA